MKRKMNKRRAARELALITFSQMEKSIREAKKVDIIDIIQKSSYVMSGEAENSLNEATNELVKIREFVQTYELEHPENLERPYDTATIPVNIPLTSDMLGRIDEVLDAVEKTYAATEMNKLISLSGIDEVKDFAVKVITTFVEKSKEVDEQIKEHSKGWDVERLVKIDRDILRIAITEMLYFEDVPTSVSIDEAVELAKKYSDVESSGFINGILGQIAKDKGLK